MMPDSFITDVPGVRVGHWSEPRAATGCTVVLTPPGGARGGVYVRGRATGTREVDALRLGHIVGRADAILCVGGSAFGLGAADGVMAWLRKRGQGFPVGAAGVVPIVPTAVVFDLNIGSADRWPSPADAQAACEAATEGALEEGSVGAGTGATVGKVLGLERAMKGGVGTASVRRGDLVVGALVVVNAFGDVRDKGGCILAGARAENDEFVDTEVLLAEKGGEADFGGRSNTTLVVVATNARLDRSALAELARMAGDALARHIHPVGTAFDGDVVFALSTDGMEGTPALQIEVLAQHATAGAILRAVRRAHGLHGIPGLADVSV